MKNLKSIKGKNIIVTGGGGYIGKKISEMLTQLGANVITIDREEQIQKLSNNFKYKVSCDMEKEQEIEMAIKLITKEFDCIDGIVNNAAFVGTSELIGWNTRFEDQSLKTWDRCMNVNLRAVFKIVQCSQDALLRSKSVASIVNIGSIYGIVGPQWDLYEGTQMGNPAAYATSKGGLVQLTKWMATTLAPNIRSNAVSAGGIFRGQDESFVERYVNKTPMKRMATEEDIANSVIFLLSDMSNYINGHNLVVDGGWTTW